LSPPEDKDSGTPLGTPPNVRQVGSAKGYAAWVGSQTISRRGNGRRLADPRKILSATSK